MRVRLSKGSTERLRRIMEIRQCDKWQAMDFAIACGWLGAEKLAMAKGSSKNPNDKAPNTGANKDHDNKATATGKPYPPKRPKAD